MVRACLEAESALASPRYQLFDHDPVPLLALGADQADYAKRLAAGADKIAETESPLSPRHALTTLEAVERPASMPPLSAQRLLRLATAASRTAALSSRQEIYPRGLAASQAVRLSLGALAGPRFFKDDDIVGRIQGRYPEAERIPGRPLLDTLLTDAGSALTWEPERTPGPRLLPPCRRLRARRWA